MKRFSKRSKSFRLEFISFVAEKRTCLLLLALAVALSVTSIAFNQRVQSEGDFYFPKKYRPPSTLQELLTRPRREREKCDIGLMNLLCAKDLPGSEDLDISQCLRVLDDMASRVRAETERHHYRFLNNRQEFNHSEGQFRMAFLMTVVQQDFEIRYNPDRMTSPGDFEPNNIFFADSKDVFIHGMLYGRHLGTCSSMPVLYVAIGRRLGYPLKLAATKNHLFIRWEDSSERFNIDGTGLGFKAYGDDRYRYFPFPVSAEEETEFGYLKSLTPAEELGVFVVSRGHCLIAQGKVDQGMESHAVASRLVPDSRIYQMILARDEETKRAAIRDREVMRIQDMQPQHRQPSTAEQIHLQLDPNPLKSSQQFPGNNMRP